MHDLILLAEAALATFADEHEAIRVFAENTRPPQLMPFARPRHPPIGEHPLQHQIADALRLEIAPPGKVSHDGVVWCRSRQLRGHRAWRSCPVWHWPKEGGGKSSGPGASSVCLTKSATGDVGPPPSSF
jgi:hypothetical protein